MEMGRIEKTKIEEITTDLGRILHQLDGMPTSLLGIFRELNQDSEEANTIRSAIIRIREADGMLRVARGRLMNLHS